VFQRQWHQPHVFPLQHERPGIEWSVHIVKDAGGDPGNQPLL